MPASEKEYKVQITKPVLSEYLVKVAADGQVTIKSLQNPQTLLLNMSDGDITCTESGHLKHNGKTYKLENNTDVIAYGGYPEKAELLDRYYNMPANAYSNGYKAYSIICENGSGSHNITLRDAAIDKISISPSYGHKASLTVCVDGTAVTRVHDIEIMDPDSKIVFDGDVDSQLKVDKITGFRAWTSSRYMDPWDLETNSWDSSGIISYDYNRPINSDEVHNFQRLQMTCGGEYFFTLATSSGNNESEASSALTYLNSLTFSDLNEGAGGNYIYLFAVSKSTPISDGQEFFQYPGNNSDFAAQAKAEKTSAIVDIKVYEGKQYGTAEYETVYGTYGKYQRAEILSGNGDLNEGAGGKYLYIYYLTAENANDKWTATNKTPITDLKICTFSRNTSPVLPDTGVYTEWVTGDNNVMIDLNKDCGHSDSKQIYIAVGRNYVNKKPTGMIESNETHHAGTIVMNSKGKVQLGEIYNNGEYNNTTGFRSGTGNTLYNAANFYSTPSIEVNSGLFSVDTYLGFHEVDWLGKIQNIDDSDPVNYPTTRPTDYPANYDFFYKAKNLIFYNFYGNDTIGKVTVNGGTLQIGANGSGSTLQP
ncbi:MAG: hypothetical protein ACI4GV_05480 [Acutalibacteraceae bacterium]